MKTEEPCNACGAIKNNEDKHTHLKNETDTGNDKLKVTKIRPSNITAQNRHYKSYVDNRKDDAIFS